MCLHSWLNVEIQMQPSICNCPIQLNEIKKKMFKLLIYWVITQLYISDLFQALERGIYFEIQYSPAIRDSTYRKYMIANAQSLMRVCKGKVIQAKVKLVLFWSPTKTIISLGVYY